MEDSTEGVIGMTTVAMVGVTEVISIVIEIVVLEEEWVSFLRWNLSKCYSVFEISGNLVGQDNRNRLLTT